MARYVVIWKVCRGGIDYEHGMPLSNSRWPCIPTTDRSGRARTQDFLNDCDAFRVSVIIVSGGILFALLQCNFAELARPNIETFSYELRTDKEHGCPSYR